MIPDQITISIISPYENDAVYINSTLRNAGITVHSLWSKTSHKCLQAIKDKKLHLIFLRTANFSAADEKIIDQIKSIQKYIPVILIHDEVNEKTLTITLQMGAHDLVSMNYPDRLTIMTCRELGSFLKARELYKLRDEIDTYQEQLSTLKSEATSPSIILIDGVIVEANPPAEALLGKELNESLYSNPILDYIHPNEQALLRGALKAVSQNNFNNEDFNIKFLSPKHGNVNMSCHLERYVYEDEDAVRLSLIVIPQADISSGNQIQLDPLTKIYHRQKFLEVAQETLQKPLESGIRSMLYLKIDSFKEHQANISILEIDKLLENFSEAIKETVSREDIFARLGGTSFAILTQKGTQADVISWAEHFQSYLKENPCEINGETITLTCCIGIADWQQEEDIFTELLQRAKTASNEARHGGVDQIKVNRHFEEITMRSQSFDIEWVARIKHALLQNKFQLFQFPISSLRMTSKNMIDVYLRMQDENGELILPNIFMPTAERNNLVKSLDRWVLGASIRYCQKNKHAKMFVRLSKRSLMDEGLLIWCNKIIAAHNITSANLVFQVTEDDLFEIKDPLFEKVQEIRQQGYGIAIEHFGKHPDHIDLLSKIEVDFVKIDSTLLQGLTDSRDRQNIIKRLCLTAGEKQVATIAEQVETAESMAILYQLGADYMQGKFTLEPEIILGSA